MTTKARQQRRRKRGTSSRTMRSSIRDVSSKYAPVQDTSKTFERVRAARVADALGAVVSEPVVARGLTKALAISRIREELVSRLRSRGGRPSLEGSRERKKLPLHSKDWKILEEIAAAVSEPGFSPSPAQIGSVLLESAIRYLDISAGKDGKEKPSLT